MLVSGFYSRVWRLSLACVYFRHIIQCGDFVKPASWSTAAHFNIASCSPGPVLQRAAKNSWIGRLASGQPIRTCSLPAKHTAPNQTSLTLGMGWWVILWIMIEILKQSNRVQCYAEIMYLFLISLDLGLILEYEFVAMYAKWPIMCFPIYSCSIIHLFFN